MNRMRWIGGVVLFLVLVYAAAPPAGAAAQADASVQITLATAQERCIAGAPMTWRIVIAPQTGRALRSIALRPGDERAWIWPQGVETIDRLTSTMVLEVIAVPLVTGDLYPMLTASYTAGGARRAALIQGERAVTVEPVESHVTADIFADRGTVRRRDELGVEVQIENRTPFTLTQVALQGIGTDLAWGTAPAPVDIRPGQRYADELRAAVDGRQPRPQVRIAYAWTDAAGRSRAGTMLASGADLAFVAFTIGEPWRTILAVLTGSLVSLIPAWIRDRQARARQERVARLHVRGLLRLMVLQSEHAADNGVRTELSPLQTVFEQEGLFGVVQEAELSERVRALWHAAERHNTGLNQPGGAQRAEDLRRAARALGQRIEDI